jgi:hypothetical protein
MAGRVKIIALVEADSEVEGLALFHQHSPQVPMNGHEIPTDIPIIYRIVAVVGDDEKVLKARRVEREQDATP